MRLWWSVLQTFLPYSHSHVALGSWTDDGWRQGVAWRTHGLFWLGVIPPFNARTHTGRSFLPTPTPRRPSPSTLPFMRAPGRGIVVPVLPAARALAAIAHTRKLPTPTPHTHTFYPHPHHTHLFFYVPNALFIPCCATIPPPPHPHRSYHFGWFVWKTLRQRSPFLAFGLGGSAFVFTTETCRSPCGLPACLLQTYSPSSFSPYHYILPDLTHLSCLSMEGKTCLPHPRFFPAFPPPIPAFFPTPCCVGDCLPCNNHCIW